MENLARRTMTLAAALLTSVAGCSEAPSEPEATVNPAPSLASVSPDHGMAGSQELLVTLDGSDFIPSSSVQVGGSTRSTTFVSSTRLTAVLTAGDLAASGTVQIRVQNPGPGGGASPWLFYEVHAPLPVADAVVPGQVPAAQVDQVVQLRGSGFIANSQVLFSGASRAVHFIDAETLDVTLLAGDLTEAGGATLVVRNPEPGGGSSAPLDLEIVNPAPSIEMLPASGATAGAPGFPLFIQGTGFTRESVVLVNGEERNTEFVTWTRLNVPIAIADVAAPGALEITVRNPGPGGGTSTPATITVRTPGPAEITSSVAVPTAIRDMVYDPVSGSLFASVLGDGAYGGSVVKVDPLTAAVTGSVFVGPEPGVLAMLAGGTVLYVGVDGSNSVSRVNVASLAVDLEWSLGAGEVAGDLACLPGEPTAIAVSLHRTGETPRVDGVTVFDDGIARGASMSGGTAPSRLAPAEVPGMLYGYDDLTAAFRFYAVRADADGLEEASHGDGLLSGFDIDIEGAAGRIYGTDGSVVDPLLLQRMGVLETSAAMALDTQTGRAFLLDAGWIRVYDINTFDPLGSLALPGWQDGAHDRIVRWGADGLAISSEGEVLLIRSPLVGS